MAAAPENYQSPAQSVPMLGPAQYRAFEQSVAHLLRPKADAGEGEYAFICGVEATLRALRSFQ
jgi:hypothetical protein